jgi:D-alanyl-lipoteichoic acid acyltransferase DltB (MBOAT superfamily)
MLFNSIHFVFFFIVVTSIYFVIPHKTKPLFLLISSCYFYMMFVPVYILILGGTIVLDFFLAPLMAARTGHARRLLLILSLVANIGILATFKYYNFFIENIETTLAWMGIENHLPYLDILLPIGLSFHTFQAMSYIIEVYRGNQKPEQNFVIYAVYVMFYPQLVAGPIERPQNMLHQFREDHPFRYEQVVDGLKLMAWGFFKKIVVADRLALMVNYVYDAPQQHEGLSIVLATVCFAFQVYCDFSGYSDIALGTAGVMGFNLMKNFDSPYFSLSISEFWRRWHISLSTWFKDYVYIPLGGSRVPKWRWNANLMIVFLISGLWHGASWMFIIWGALHGIFLILENVTKGVWSKIARAFNLAPVWLGMNFIRLAVTFSCVCFAWIFFRAASMKDATYMVTHLFSGWRNSISSIMTNINLSREHNLYLGLSFAEFVAAWLSVLVLLAGEWYQKRRGISNPLILFQHTRLRWAVYYVLLMAIVLLGVYSKSQQFIYFQF